MADQRAALADDPPAPVDPSDGGEGGLAGASYVWTPSIRVRASYQGVLYDLSLVQVAFRLYDSEVNELAECLVNTDNAGNAQGDVNIMPDVYMAAYRASAEVTGSFDELPTYLPPDTDPAVTLDGVVHFDRVVAAGLVVTTAPPEPTVVASPFATLIIPVN